MPQDRGDRSPVESWFDNPKVPDALRRAAELAAMRREVFGDANAPWPPVTD